MCGQGRVELWNVRNRLTRANELNLIWCLLTHGPRFISETLVAHRRTRLTHTSMASKSPITCHVLDSSIGKPAQGVKVHLLVPNVQDTTATAHASAWVQLGSSVTNADGRCSDLLSPSAALQPGSYQVVFETKEYFERSDRKSFYPFVQITFTIENPSEHYHVPLLISPFSYTTYRGS